MQGLQGTIEKLQREVKEQNDKMMCGASQTEKDFQCKVAKLGSVADMLTAEVELLKTNETSLQMRIHQLEVELEIGRDVNAQLSKDLTSKADAYKCEIERMSHELEIQSQSESTHKHTIAEMIDEMRKAHERHLEEAEEHDKTWSGDRDAHSKAVKELQKELQEVSAVRDHEVAALKDKTREFSKVDAQLRAEMKELQAELTRRNSMNQKAKNDSEAAHLREIEDLQDQMESKRKETQVLRRKMDEEMGDKDTERDGLVRAAREKDGNMERLVVEMESLKLKSNDATQRETRSKHQLRELQDQVEVQREVASKSTRDLQKERETLGREIRDLQDLAQQRQKQEQKLRAEIDDLQRARQRLLDQVICPCARLGPNFEACRCPVVLPV